MARLCDKRSKESRLCRKRALLAAARHGTVELPLLAAPHKHGQSNKYFVHDLLSTWHGFIDEGVDVPPLLHRHCQEGDADADGLKERESC